MNLEQHISKLLFNYDCVIIPGFGGFVGNYHSASVHPTMHLFLPPTKSIVFNRNLKSNDGLLANELVSAEGMNYNEALMIIDKYVQASEKILNDGRKLSLEKVGSLFYDIEKTLQFEADTSMNYLMDSYGLTSVQSFPVKRDTVYAGRELKSMDHPMEQVLIHKNNYSKHLWKAAVVVPLIGLGIWFTLNTHVFDKKNISQDSLNPFNNKMEVLAPKIDYAAPPKETVANTSSETTPAITNDNTSDKKINEAVTPAAATGNYLIVAGCFKVLDNANKFVEQLKAKGFNASICGQNEGGLNRVVYNSYSTKEEASAALNEIHKQDPNAWLLGN
jgi:cell division septation protein DedD